MSAVLFGSISTVADTSELQRRAFNEAFDKHGLGWNWAQDEYRALLVTSGGADRIQAYAVSLGQEVDAAAVHQTKSELFHQLLASEGVAPRAGLIDTIWNARTAGYKVGLVTTTSPENVKAVISALHDSADLPDFDVVVDVSQVAHPKPDKEAYQLAVRRLGHRGPRVVAVEDNIGGFQSATAAGLPCVVFPNRNTSEHDFEGAVGRVDRLDFAELRGYMAVASA